MATIGLNHVSVSADDVDESARFYQDVFGMSPIPAPNFGHPVIWLRIGDLQIHLFQRGATAPPYHHFALTVDDLGAVHRAAAERGCLEGERPLRRLPDGGIQLYLRDPGGNLVEIDGRDDSSLPGDVRATVRDLADDQPQNGDNRTATLFLI